MRIMSTLIVFLLVYGTAALASNQAPTVPAQKSRVLAELASSPTLPRALDAQVAELCDAGELAWDTAVPGKANVNLAQFLAQRTTGMLSRAYTVWIKGVGGG
jgi:hypothetical protein